MNRLKQALGLAGLLLALAGIALEQPFVIWIAIALLATSVVLRAVLSWRERRGRAEHPGSGDEARQEEQT